jgi:hypothetical protein
VGGGGSGQFTSVSADFQGQAESGGRALRASLQPKTGGSAWFLDFVAPAGGVLAPGTYDNATRAGFQSAGVPGLSVTGHSRGCNTSTGRFVVHEAQWGPNDTVLKFHASFEQHCEGGTPALRGEFALLLAPPTLPPPTGGPTSSVLTYVSDPGDYVGAGQSATLTPAAAAIAITERAWGIEATVTPAGSPFALWNIGMASNGLPPSTGLYEFATRYPISSSGPTFSFHGDGRGCNQLSATYQVHQLVRATDGSISRLQVTFEQHCEMLAPALRGELIYIRP